jgi:serine/threonine protein kinase/predicted ATPase/Tfp pilus assembly protein PilF
MTTTAQLNSRFQIRIENGKQALIGQGGMGTVYHGIDTYNDTPVAIKLLRTEVMGHGNEMLERFAREGEALRQLNHPNIVKMLDAIDVNGEHYLVMEYVTGGSLRDVLEKTPRFTVQRALYISLDIADALTRAHRLNIYHRDIKPDNVLIADDGTPRLTDFGMARLSNRPQITQDGAIVGTLAYMSPEIFNGEHDEEKSDIWAFGVMLYEMLAGKRPFHYEQPGQLINAIITQPVLDLETLRPDVPVALVDLVYRMLHKDPKARISSVRLVGAELEAIIRGDGKIMLPAAVADGDNRFDTETPLPRNLPTSQRIAPNNLPSQPTAFIGRGRELQELNDLLHEPNARIVTVLGTGGLGKTRLALEFGAKQLTQFPDGVYFVSLAPIEKQDYIGNTIAEALNFGGNRDNLNELLDFLAEKRMLLLMDNFEHVSSGAGILNDITQRAPYVKILATSRERLRLRGETIYELDNLAIPNVNAMVTKDIANFDSVKLFLQSARRVMPDFELTDENAQSIAAILKLVQGLPLGIELAGAWVEMLPVDEIVREIEKSLDFLETDLRDVPERHRSIRAVFDYSWNLMTPEEQEIFVRLSVFRGGFERDAAEKVSKASLKTLMNLVNKSILQREPSGRYYVHKLLRQYAEERSEPEQTMQALMEHGKYYGAMFDGLMDTVDTPKEVAAFDIMERELDNMRLAWDSAIAAQMYEVLLDGVDPLTNFYLRRSMMKEGKEMLQQLLDSLTMTGKSQTFNYFFVMNRKILLAARMGHHDVVIRYAHKVYEFFKNQPEHNIVEMSLAMNNLSYSSMMHGDYAKSIEYASEAIRLLGDVKNVPMWYMAMGHYGYAHYLSGNLIEARYIYESIIDATNRYPTSYSGIAHYQNNLGEILRDLGEASKARELFESSLKTFKEEKNLRGVAFSMNNLAGILFVQAHFEEAEKMYQETYRIYREIGDRYGLGHSLSAMGNIKQVNGDYSKAHEYYLQSLDLRRELNDKRGIADSLMDLALTEMNMEQLDKAKKYIEESIAIRHEIKDMVGLTDALIGKSMGFMNIGEYDEAETAAKEALEIGTRIGYQAGDQSYMILGLVALKRKDFEAAKRYFEICLHTIHTHNYYGVAYIGLVGMGLLRLEMGDNEGALRIVSKLEHFPSRFVRMIKELYDELLERVHALFTAESVTLTLTPMRDVDMKEFIDLVLKGEA